ncbi:exonuclease 3'-5' domain-containing protein 2-like isoform 1-T1 [Glossina fuscipes fuscipes]
MITIIIFVGLVCVVIKCFSNYMKRLEEKEEEEMRRNKIYYECMLNTHQNESDKACDDIVNTLRAHCKHYKVLGFDCEWVSVGRSRNPVALLQLASPNGFCGLFRLCHMHHIPQSLKNLLVDKEIIKVGVDPAGDAQKLQEDNGIYVASTFDIRYLAVMLRCKPLGLEKLSRSLLNVDFVKRWYIAKSNWEFDKLDPDQVEYAANDAFAGIEIFKHLANRLKPRNYWNFTNADFMAIMSEIQYLLDRGFSKDTPITLSQDIPITRLQFCPLVSEPHYYNVALLSHKDYLLAAPNGRPLCVVSKSKGKWYLQERLGEKIKSEAFTIRLYNQPFAEENGYWLTSNQHECVVCGQKDAFVSKDVVPSEYRMHFPLITQFFTSSDVLHLCPKCNVSDIISDIRIRTALSQKCDAPYSFDQVTEVKRAAETLLTDDNAISTGKRNHLKTILSTHFEEGYIDHQRIVEASNQYSDWPEYEHGEKVVNKFQTEFGGLKELEIFWRNNFVADMKPKNLPSFWNWPIDWKYKPEVIRVVA